MSSLHVLIDGSSQASFLNVLCSLPKTQSTQALRMVLLHWTDVDYHHGLGISSQRVF